MSCLFFFFSSRRRHTRLQGDWSSDVCSSDLEGRDDGRKLREEPQGGPVFVLRIADAATGVEHPKGRHSRLQCIHGMSGLGETLDQVDDLELDPPVPRDIRAEPFEFQTGRQVAEKEEERGFEKRAFRGKLFNADAAVLQDATLAVHITDPGAGGGHARQTRHEIMRHRKKYTMDAASPACAGRSRTPGKRRSAWVLASPPPPAASA